MPKPPLGVMPLYLWREKNPRPSRHVRAERRRAVEAAIRRYRAASMQPLREWIAEVYS